MGLPQEQTHSPQLDRATTRNLWKKYAHALRVTEEYSNFGIEDRFQVYMAATYWPSLLRSVEVTNVGKTLDEVILRDEIGLAKKYNLSAKFSGSGGAIIGLVPDDINALTNFQKEVENEGFVFVMLKGYDPTN